MHKKTNSIVKPLVLNFSEAVETNAFVKELMKGKFSLCGSNGIQITLPEDWVLVGGSTIDLSSLKLPVSAEIQGNEIKALLGCNLIKSGTTESTSKNMTDMATGEKYDSSTRIETETTGIWENIKKGLEGERDAWKNAKTTAQKKKIQKKLSDKYGLSMSQLSSNNKKKTGITADALGYIEGKIINGKFVMTSLMISVSGKFTISYTAQLDVGYVGVEGEGSAKFELSKSRPLADPDMEFGTDAKVTVTPAITLRGGLGWDGVASIGAYGKAEMPTWLELSFSKSNTELGLQIIGEIGYEGQLLVWKTGRKPLVSGKTKEFTHIWKWNSPKKLSPSKKSNPGKDESATLNDISTTVIERPNTEQKWLGSTNVSLPKKIKGSSLSSAVTFKTLQSDSYSKNDAKIITAGNKTVAVWLTEDKNRDAYNWQKLVYSVYNEANNTWSEPKSVCDDGYLDASPSLATDGENIYVVWQKFVKEFNAENSTTASQILEAGEIYLSKFDSTSSSFKGAERITSNNVYDYNPTVTVKDGVAYVHYSTNPNNVLLSANGNSISRYVNGTTTVLKNDLSTVSSIVSAVVDNEVQLTYSVDADGDLSTTQDVSLFSGTDSFKRIEKFGENEVAILNFAYAEIDGKNTLVWSDGANIYYEKDGKIVSILENGASISSKLNCVTDSTGTYLFWTASNGEKEEINYCNYNNGKWTEAIALTSRNNKLSNIAVTSLNNKILGLASETLLSYDETTEQYSSGETNFMAFSVNDYCDITVSDVEVDDTLLETGDAVSVSVVVENNGNTNVDTMKFNLSDSNGTSKSYLVEADLLPGKSELYYLPYEIVKDFALSTITVNVEVDGDVDLSDNTALYSANTAKVAITESSVQEHADGYIVEAAVCNESLVLAKNVTVKSSLGDENDAEPNGEVVVGNLESDENTIVQFAFDKKDLVFDENGVVNVYLEAISDNSESQKITVLLESDNSVCGHPIIEERSEIPATCTEKGKKAGEFCTICEKYASGGEDIPENGHTEEVLPETKATCTESGLTEGKKCSVCGVVLEEQKEVPALGHDFVIDTEAKEPTCTEPGTTEGSHCTRCDYKVEAEVLPALGHYMVTIEGKPATCTESGLTEGEKCSVCGVVLEEQKEVPVLGHDFVIDTEAKEPTCTEPGTTEGLHCTRCDYKVEAEEISALGHTDRDGDGKCDRCGYFDLIEGECGDNAHYKFYPTGELVISGTGSIEAKIRNLSFAYSISKVTIEDGITEIGDDAFWDCDGLTSVTIPDSVTSIGRQTFSNCRSLTSITIPDSVTSIGSSAFSNCDGLTSVTIPDSVTSIDYGAFSSCTGLTQLTVSSGNKIYYSKNNCIIKTKEKKLVVGCKTSIIPSDGSVTSIYISAFSGCTGLTSITIPDSVTSIDHWAFSGCTGLTSITVSSGNKVYHSENNCIIKTKEKELVVGCKTSIIPSDGSVTSISDYAFRGCTGLTSVTIPNSVTSIGDSAFSGCTGLTNITIPDSVTSIGQNAFSGTAYYNNSDNWENGVLYIGKHLIKAKETVSGTYDIKYGTKTITEYAFYGCADLTSITIPDSVTSIVDYAFYDCIGLTSVTIPDSVTSIGDFTFSGCTGLTSITIPDSVTSIGDWAFRNCTGLTNVKIPDSVTNIGWYAFENCTGLTSITIPDSVTSIWGSVFDGCTGLTSIIIPDSVTSIGYYAFRGCTGLISISIPNNVTYIGYHAFDGCTGLTSITIPNSVMSIDGYAFYDCTGLTSITIPDSVTSIGDNAFGYYYNDYDSDVEKIDNFTIYGYPNTAAETYATENGFTFISLDDEHIHSFSEWKVTKEATCTEEGEETRSCFCGETQTRKIEKIDHVMFTVVEPSTCKVKGVSYDVCDMCNETFNYTVLPLAPHTFSAWTVTKKATCETAGEKTKTCSVCGTSETEEISALEHSFKHVLKNATCKEEGFEKDVCENCGKEINAKVLPVTAHTFSAWTVTKEATVFESGERERSCSVCGFEEKETIEKLKSEEVKDEKTDISVICPDGSYNGKVEIEVKETFDGESYHILNSERGNYKKSLFDITTFVDGKKAQPNGSVWVKIPLPESYNPEKTTVYHVTNEGKLEKIESHVEGGYIIFETTHFSYYAIVDEGSQINPSSNCSCACHKKGLANLFFKIVLFFQKIFKKNRICKCGVWHY